MLKSVTISMFKERLTAFLKIRPEEIHMVVLMAGLFLCIQAGQGIGENAAFALFLASIDVEYLPYMYMGLGGVVFVASITYSTSLSRFQNAVVVQNLLAGAAVLFGLEWLVVVLFRSPISYPLLWLTAYGMAVILATLLWTSAGEVCDARQAKRLFPLFASMGILGSVLGNLLTGAIAALTGAQGLILFYSILLGAGYLLLRRISRTYFLPKTRVNAPFNLVNDLRAGYDFVSRSQLFRLMAISSILYSVLFFTLDFPFSERISSVYTDDAAGLAGFKGLFTSVTTAVTFLVSLLLANRFFTRFGVVNGVLVMPLTYLAAFLLFFASFSFWGAVGARFGQLVVLGGLASTAWSALFNVVPPARRGQVMAFNNGVPTQIGVVFSGVLIILSRQVLGTQQVLLLGAFVAVATTYMTLKMRSAYGDALLNALQAGCTEVFSGDEESFSGYKDDPSAMQVILKALHDPRANTRRLAAEMLGRMGNILAAPDLVERLSDEDATVRFAATNALADLRAKQAISEIIIGLSDPDDSVRNATLASLPKLGVDPSPELTRVLKRLMTDVNVRVRAHAAAILIHLGEVNSAQELLSRLLKSGDVSERLMALNAMKHIAESVQGKFPMGMELVLGALADESLLVRRDAVRVLALLRAVSNLEPLINCLGDEDAEVRKTASEALRQVWDAARSRVLRILDGMEQKSLDAALDTIPPGDPEVLEVVRDYIHREVSNLQNLRMLFSSLTGTGPAVNLLVETLKHRETLGEERLVKAVGLFGNMRAMQIVRRSLNAGDGNTRAAALEALETLGDPAITKQVLPILDNSGLFKVGGAENVDIPMLIGGLLESDDYWLRALAARAAQELGLTGCLPVLRRSRTDAVRLVRETVEDALAEMDGGEKMKTLRTLSTLDRILLMREIPMFSRLAPEDLEKIAEVAVEQLFPAGTAICREGEPGDSLYVIVQGTVKVLKKSDSDQTLLAVRGEGEFVGEMAILESTMRFASLQADTDVRILVLEGGAFKAILRDRPEVAISVLQHMSRRLRELSGRVGTMA
jgi:HEAT repeat protein/ATP/ADP translocase